MPTCWRRCRYRWCHRCKLLVFPKRSRLRQQPEHSAIVHCARAAAACRSYTREGDRSACGAHQRTCWPVRQNAAICAFQRKGRLSVHMHISMRMIILH